MTRPSFLLVVLLLSGRLLTGQAPVTGSLPPWTAGTFDIHHIATGRGNATFFQFPDGTTLLVDAGAVTPPLAWADPLPDGSRPPGAWVVDYIRQFAGAAARLDYGLITHFHPDHFGDVTASHPKDAAGHVLNGMTEVMAALHPRVMIDRGWPAYEYPSPLITAPSANSRVERNAVGNYKAIVDDEVKAGRLQVVRATAGSATQIVPVRDAQAWPFEVRVVAVNGEVWTGNGDAAEATFPPIASIPADDVPDENMCSIALRFRYGRFDYFTGGDLPGDPEGAPAWQGVEQRVGQVVGKTDVHQVNHHGSIDPSTPSFLAALQSRVIVVPAWAPTHPSPDALKRILNTRYYPGPRDVFVLALREPMTHAIGGRVQQLKSPLGHVVVRVEPGGNRYRVFVLDATSPARPVKAAFGPYESQ
jgi:beta-lactamase superfamily II metal-dependent hydrolase